MPSSESDFNSFVSETPFELLSCQIWSLSKFSSKFEIMPSLLLSGSFKASKPSLAFGFVYE